MSIHFYKLCLVLVFNFWGASLFAATVLVPQNYSSIQLAIDSAQDGDTILVSPGIYNEAIVIEDKEIYLKSLQGPELTVIDATGKKSSVVSCLDGAEAKIEGFEITGGTGTLFLGRQQGGGLFVLQSDCSVLNSVIEGNVAENGGGVFAFSASAKIIDSVIRNNHAAALGAFSYGGGVRGYVSFIDIVNSKLYQNTANYGGGLHVEQGGEATLINSIVAYNEAGVVGGGLMAYNASVLLRLYQSVVYGNTAQASGGLRVSNFSNLETLNSIVWGNFLTNGSNDQSPVFVSSAATASISFSNIEGGWDGEGNTNLDPNFLDPSLSIFDFRLTSSSPLIDAGSNSLLPSDDFDLDEDADLEEALPLDHDGGQRIAGLSVDMGAYELQSGSCPADITSDGIVDSADLLRLISDWGLCVDCESDITGDAVVDIFDLQILLADWGVCP